MSEKIHLYDDRDWYADDVAFHDQGDENGDRLWREEVKAYALTQQVQLAFGKEPWNWGRPEKWKFGMAKKDLGYVLGALYRDFGEEEISGTGLVRVVSRMQRDFEQYWTVLKATGKRTPVTAYHTAEYKRLVDGANQLHNLVNQLYSIRPADVSGFIEEYDVQYGDESTSAGGRSSRSSRSPRSSGTDEHPVRRAILSALRDRDELTVSDLAGETGYGSDKINGHIGVLVSSGQVEKEDRGSSPNSYRIG